MILGSIPALAGGIADGVVNGTFARLAADEAAGVGGGGSTTFLHGAAASSIDDILSNGGNLRPVSVNTHQHPAGSLFTHEAGHEMSHIATTTWPLVRGMSSNDVAVVAITVPNTTLRALQARGLVSTGPVPGFPYFPVQETVFLPEALSVLNSAATFVKLPPAL